MKAGIHPELKQAQIICACGNVIDTRSIRGDFKIDICSGCHPFFTGKQKLIDAEGRVERFNRKYRRAQ
ncbi:MAG: 50S ribosomal protein L31 [Deltaproteobacteria bacterium RIFOXYA12_FULL_58_15]|nr:MAG: 50S ribosomal protein L31 [Deltaproteobacteria bacterium RIFOXYA12_FULL_58_15]OGR09788.1 MAG: 50S ribosomal protein L31 [Deltaproteobacteria bacterium RIFOXYB12_FULL_58_9]